MEPLWWNWIRWDTGVKAKLLPVSASCSLFDSPFSVSHHPAPDQILGPSNHCEPLQSQAQTGLLPSQVAPLKCFSCNNGKLTFLYLLAGLIKNIVFRPYYFQLESSSRWYWQWQFKVLPTILFTAQTTDSHRCFSHWCWCLYSDHRLQTFESHTAHTMDRSPPTHSTDAVT